MRVTAAIVTIGNELTCGLTVDTTSAYLSGRLNELGIETILHQTVDDHTGRIVEAIRRAAAVADAVVVAGGLGPTEDDLTRAALAEAMGVELELRDESLGEIEAFFARRGYPMNETNRRQAFCPVGAEALSNPVGTAPAICATVDGAVVFVVPGVPAEMRRLTDMHILPRLRRLAGDGRVVFRAVHTFGAGESTVGARLADLMSPDGDPHVGTTCGGGVVSVRVTARGVDQQRAEQAADATVAEIRRRLGAWVYGLDDETMGSAVGRLLAERNRTVSLAESCTGGLAGKLISDTPGCSRYFLGAVVSYANRIKQAMLGVAPEVLDAHGAVSEATAEAMAAGVRERFGADYGLAITGIAGPAGGGEAKPVGRVYTAVAGPDGVEVRENNFPGDRAMVRLRSALTALNLLRLELTTGRA